MRDAYFGLGAHAWAGDAADVYSGTRYRHTGSEAPFGMLLWWLGGTEGHGHVTASLGDGTCLTTDFADDGYVGDGRIRRVPIDAIARYSSPRAPLRLMGWTEDIDGSVVPVALTDEDKAWISGAFVEAIAAVMWGANTKEPGGKLHIADSGSWNTYVTSNNIKAVLDRLASTAGAASSGGYTLEQIAAAVADELKNRLAG